MCFSDFMIVADGAFKIVMSTRHVFWQTIRHTGGLVGSIKRVFITDPNYVPEEDDDPAPLEDRVKNWWWVLGVFLSTIVSCALMATQFNIGV